jgi:hypothetical protein
VRQLLVFVGILALLGCSDDGEKSPAQRLSGNWIAEDSVDLCAVVVSFEDDYIEFKEICELTDGSLAIVIDSGFFEANDTTFTWHAEASSCADADGEPEKVRYNVEGDQLTLIWPDGVIAFTRVKKESGGPGVIADFGCFDDEGFFEPRAVQPI